MAFGEVRDIAGPRYAMVLKSRLLAENPPLRGDYLFQKITARFVRAG